MYYLCFYDEFPIKIWYACISPANYMVDVGAQVELIEPVVYLHFFECTLWIAGALFNDRKR